MRAWLPWGGVRVQWAGSDSAAFRCRASDDGVAFT